MTADRFSNDDRDYAARRKAKRHEAEVSAQAESTRRMLEENKDRVEAFASGAPPPIPVFGPPGPPPSLPAVNRAARFNNHSANKREVTPDHYVPAEVLGGMTILPNGVAVLEACTGVRLSASKAGLLVSSPNLSKPDWFPVSGINDDSDCYEPGTTGNLILEPWVAKKRGWE